MDLAAQATFALAAFQAHGLPDDAEGEEGPPLLPPGGQTAAAVTLHKAAMAGSPEALYALADRLYLGIGGIQRNESLALKYAELAADRLVEDVEKVRVHVSLSFPREREVLRLTCHAPLIVNQNMQKMAVGAYLAPTELRERWMDTR